MTLGCRPRPSVLGAVVAFAILSMFILHTMSDLLVTPGSQHVISQVWHHGMTVAVLGLGPQHASTSILTCRLIIIERV